MIEPVIPDDIRAQQRGRWKPDLTWFNYGLSNDAVLRQLVWERGRAMARMQSLGHSWEEIIEYFGASKTTVAIHMNRYKNNPTPPINGQIKWFGLD